MMGDFSDFGSRRDAWRTGRAVCAFFQYLRLFMGIKGLIKALDSICKPIHIKEYSGSTAGIDALCWLHRAAYSCAQDLVLGKPTTRYLSFCKHMLNLLINNGITPYVVFDGNNLPIKLDTREIRKERRIKNKKLAIEYMKKGDMDMAMQYFRRAIKVTSDMIQNFIDMLKTMHIKYIVAPFEADSQLAFLYQRNLVQFCISEDSDLLVFGIEKVVYKLEKNGMGTLIDISNLAGSLKRIKESNRKLKASDYEFVKSFCEFSNDKFIDMCILSGCDYLESPPKVGLKTAMKLVKQYKDTEGLLRMLSISRKHKLENPEEYKKQFILAKQSFLHQTVINPDTLEYTFLTEPDVKLGLTLLLPTSDQKRDSSFIQNQNKENILQIVKSTSKKDSAPFLKSSKALHFKSNLSSTQLTPTTCSKISKDMNFIAKSYNSNINTSKTHEGKLNKINNKRSNTSIINISNSLPKKKKSSSKNAQKTLFDYYT